MIGPLIIRDGYLITPNEPPAWYAMFLSWRDRSYPPTVAEVTAAHEAYCQSAHPYGLGNERAFYESKKEQFLLWCRLSLRRERGTVSGDTWTLIGVGKCWARAAEWMPDPRQYTRKQTGVPVKYGWYFHKIRLHAGRSHVALARRPGQRVKHEGVGPGTPPVHVSQEPTHKSVTGRDSVIELRNCVWFVELDGYPLPGEAVYDGFLRSWVFGR